MFTGMPHLIGVDAGTSVIKAVLFDPEGNELLTAGEKVPVLTGVNYTAEQDMEQVWQAVRNSVKTLLAGGGIDPASVVAIGVTGQGDGCWLIDEGGRPVRPAILWSDGRAAAVVNEWQEQGITKEVWKINGTVLFPGSQAPILQWLRINEAGTLRQARWSLYCKDWVAFKLTGEVATDETDASRQFFDILNRSYAEHLIDVFNLRNYRYLLPPILPTGAIRGYLQPGPAAAIGLPSGIPVVAGPLDVVASALGLGCINEESAFTILGTTIFNGFTLNAPSINQDEAGMNICHGLPDKWLRGMPLMSGTPNLDWFLENLGHKFRWQAGTSNLDVYKHLDEVIDRVPPGAGGVMYHPYISPAGERAPFVNTSARAQFIGLSLLANTENLLRAVYEGLSYAIRDSFDDVLDKISELRLCGGGAKSRVWPQIIADVTGKEVSIAKGTEFGAKGAALNAGVAVGFYDSLSGAIAKTVGFARKYFPDKRNHEKYNAFYKVYRMTRKTMPPLWEALQCANSFTGQA
ncbi:FGGY-family carbohydrate kinase [Moorella naiadis]|uniref:FGGY-family carbohydrate kinase n=1 Tax=Moorella naiadis (nom. illeg.) TaxID=3093670 RepID=UPI003D9C9A94